MTRVQIMGIRSDLQKVVNKLHHLGTLQIDDINNIPDISAQELSLSADTQKAQEDSKYLITQIRGLIESLGCIPSKENLSSNEEVSLEEIRKNVNQLIPQIHELNLHKRELEGEFEILPRYGATLKKLLPIVPSTANKPGNTTVGVLIDVSHIKTLDAISKRILEITKGKAEFVSDSIDETFQAMLVVCPRGFSSEIETFLGEKDVSQLQFPNELSNLTPGKAMEAIEQRLDTIPNELKMLGRSFEGLANKWCEPLNRWLLELEESLDETEILSRFGETEHTFIVYGWVPTRDFEALKRGLEEEIGERIFVTALKTTPETQKLAPIALDNPKVSHPFESLVRLRAVPRYDDIDPTNLMALFLPLFFGMILGDVGYGLVLLLISLFLSKRMKPGFLKDISKVLFLGSIWSIIFGFLYGEAFGPLGEQIGLRPIWMDRANPENMIGLLLSSIGVGAIHVIIGLIVGVWQAVTHKSRNHLLERGGMLIGVMGLFMLVGTLVNFLPNSLTTPSIAVIVVGIALLGASFGIAGIFLGPIEFIGVIGNILSYLRIAAIGLASVYLAKVAYDMAGMLGSLIVGALIVILINALNLVMGTFSSTIHGLRLHYVEFFRKFYQGGGRPYEPFHNHPPPGK